METKLQIALDVLSLNEALDIARQVADYVDIIELGTPLLKEESSEYALKIMKAKCPNKKILADLKTMDTGEIEAKIAFKAGADIMTVCAAANIATIEGALSVAKKMKKQVLVEKKSIIDLITTAYIIIH